MLEAQDVMAVLANDPAAPADLREKSLRLAAHLLEYDPDLRGGTGYRRARELLESGAALKQMHKIIEAQGPSGCRTDLGTLTADITATSDGAVEAIDCLRLNRLARTAGAPIDKGAGIKIFKKIGDRVEKGEPLYRIHAFEQSQFDLALAAAKGNTGYVTTARTATRPSRERGRNSMPKRPPQGYDTVGGREGRHTHPGLAFVHVEEGALTLDYEGKPTVTYKVGESFYVEPGKIHEGINKGNTPIKAIATFVVEKGKPLTTQESK